MGRTPGQETGKETIMKERNSEPTLNPIEGQADRSEGKGDDILGFANMSDIYNFFGSIKWSWKNYIPIGHLTMIAGVQGQGKSYPADIIFNQA